ARRRAEPLQPTEPPSVGIPATRPPRRAKAGGDAAEALVSMRARGTVRESTMGSPARSICRIALAATLAFSLVARPGIAAAQTQPGESLIRDTEIEEILHRDA